MSFRNLSDIFREAVKRNPVFGRRLKEAQAVGRWESVVGPGIARHARAARVDRGILWIEVDHPIWKQELMARKRQILDRLNEGIEAEGQIQDLRLAEGRG